MYVNQASPTQESRLCDPQKDPIFVKAYGHIVSIIQSEKTDKEKIETITDIFAEAIRIYQDDLIVLQEQCMEELDKENQLLTDANDKLIIKHHELTTKIADLANQIHLLAEQNGLISQSNDQLKRALEELVRENQSNTKKHDDLERVNLTLIEKINSLSERKAELVSQQNQLTQRLENSEGDTKQLLEQSKIQSDHHRELQEKLNRMRENYQRLDSALQEYEIKEAKAELNEWLDIERYSYTGLLFAVGVIGSGGLGGVLAGGCIYGVHLTAKHIHNRKLEKQLKSYSKEHPEASEVEIWNDLMMQRRNGSNQLYVFARHNPESNPNK
jgi:hypothetical protein